MTDLENEWVEWSRIDWQTPRYKASEDLELTVFGGPGSHSVARMFSLRVPVAETRQYGHLAWTPIAAMTIVVKMRRDAWLTSLQVSAPRRYRHLPPVVLRHAALPMSVPAESISRILVPSPLLTAEQERDQLVAPVGALSLAQIDTLLFRLRWKILDTYSDGTMMVQPLPPEEPFPADVEGVARALLELRKPFDVEAQE
jgi:hypothetical protein